jgi:hypothetical protein
MPLAVARSLVSVPESPPPTRGKRERATLRRKTFNAITRVLEDGSWHELDDLRRATSFPADWVRALEAEGLLDKDERDGQTLVRLRPEPSAA